MKYKPIFSLLFLLLHSLFVNAQFNTFNPKVEKKKVSLFVENHIKEESLERKRKIDTVFIQAEKQEIKNNSIANGLYTPLKNLYITSHYGVRFHPIDNQYKFHRGIDLRAKQDTVFAMYGGEIIESGYSSSLGNFVKVSFNEFVAIYAHLSKYFVKAGQIVQSGAKLGVTGSTGKSTGEHLHLTIRSPNGNSIDPALLLEKITK